MSEPIITEQARADLDEAWDYLAARSPKAADRLIDRFAKGARMHAQFPGSGRPRDEIAPNLRSFVVTPDVAFDRPTGDTIEVLRFLHGRRDVERILREK